MASPQICLLNKFLPLNFLESLYCNLDDETGLHEAIDKYMAFYTTERIQARYDGKTPAQVRTEALATDTPTQYPIPVNKRIQKYKAKYAA